MTTKEIGDIGERAAERFLKKNGYKIKGRNCHFSHNELDIIAENDNFITDDESSIKESLKTVGINDVTVTKQ